MNFILLKSDFKCNTEFLSQAHFICPLSNEYFLINHSVFFYYITCELWYNLKTITLGCLERKQAKPPTQKLFF